MKNTRQHTGFALIATITIMVLIVMVALAMLSLSTITNREQRQGNAKAEAQANARIALMLAIGELQKQTGSDTRITASSSIVDPNSASLLGVWKSWEGTNHDSNGRPIQPDYASKTKLVSDSGRFLTWLASGLEQGGVTLDPQSFASRTASQGSVPLLGVGTLGDASDNQVHLIPQPVELNPGNGTYAWWVSGENQKARLMEPQSPHTDDEAGWADMAKSHTAPDLAVMGLEELIDNPEPVNKALSRNTIALLKPNNTLKPHQSFHDFSSSAIGLLTNTATGGWRKDLSLLSEKWDDIYNRYAGGRLPLFRYAPVEGATSMVPKPTESSYDPDQSNLYPWSNYVLIGDTKYPVTNHAASASWQNLVYFAKLYRTISYDDLTKTPKGPFGWNTSIAWHRGGNVPNAHFYRHYHELSYDPVVARIQLIVQANALQDPNPSRTDAEKYHRINLRLVPIITLWNPYSLELSKELIGAVYQQGRDNDFGIGTQRSLPITMSIINGTMPPGGGFEPYYRLLNGGNSLTADGKLAGAGFGHYYDKQIPENILKGYGDSYFRDMRSFHAWMPLEFSLKAGEVKSYAPSATAHYQWSGGIRLKNGYSAGDDYGAPIATPDSFNNYIQVPGRPRNELHINDLVRFAMRSDRYTKIYSDTITNKAGAGAYFSVGTPNWPVSLEDVNAGKVPKGTSYLRQVMAVNIDPEWAAEYWPNDELDEIQYSVADLVPGNGNPPWTNIFSISFGPRLTFGAGYGNPQNRPTKGMLQASPLISKTYSVPEKEVNYHPVHNAYDLSYSSMPVNSNLSPEVGTEGYIVSGFQSGEGLSRMIMAEIPLRPLVSLAELQTWNVRGGNPLPPYQYYLIGNSDATPLIRQDSVLRDYAGPEPAVDENLQHDDSYCSNHLLFDDFFFSSIAPRPVKFGNTIAKNIETVYRDFLEGNDTLNNRAYRPIQEDSKLSSTEANERIAEVVNSPEGDGWLKVASRFEVEGMFNVNSTSVKAWRALLGHARKQQIAYHKTSGIGLDSAEHDHVVSRTTVAADVKAGTAAGLGAAFPSGSQYAGFRTLSESQLDELAGKIVEQVKKRGPFLSLAEFVNRQLSTDEELAIAGALQSALNSLTDDPNEDLKKSANQLSSETIDPADGKLANAGYAFDEAAKGMSTHGFPGWIRQADVLRPIAPVLSARDDTFTIRAYGDARDSDGNVLARAWCEATVRRTRDFVDPSADPADSIEPPEPHSDPTKLTANQIFGRRYIVTSFRWLNEDEV